MKNSWPKVTCQISFEFEADHSMPKIGKGCECRHTHKYEVIFGWTHEIQPRSGYTHELMEHRADLEVLIKRLRGQYLNDVLPMQPSVEVMAVWLLANTDGAYCDHVIVKAYGDYTVRADRAAQRSEWSMFFAGYSEAPFTGPLK